MSAKDKLPNEWTQLVEIQGIKLISSMYIWLFIVPISAKALALMDGIAPVTVFDYQFELQLALPFSWNVFYFSALFFVIGHLTFNLRCPKLIKQHPTYSSFKGEGKPVWHLSGYSQDIGLDYDKFVQEYVDQREMAEEQPLKGEELKQEIFWHLVWHAERCRKLAFWVCLISYSLGFSLIAIVIVQNLWWVLTSL